MSKKRAWLYALVIAIFVAINVLIIVFANKDRPRFSVTEDFGTEYETARVLAITQDNSIIDKDVENVRKGSQDLKLEILTGRYKGNISFVRNYFSALYNVNVSVGDKVCVRIDTTEKGVYSVSIYNYNRIPLIAGLVVLFLAALVIVGGVKGLKAFAGLAYTFVCVMFILLPLTLKGYNAIGLTAIILFVTTLVCFLLIGGISEKSLVAETGCMLGVLAAFLVGIIAQKIGGVTTFQMDEAEALLLVKSTFALKMRGLFVAGILISSVGAVMDVSMSIASALFEIREHGNGLTFSELFKSGMNVGKDAMGTMANTLVLAYAGSALNMMVLIYSYGVSFRQLLCTDFVAIELIYAVSGSIGIICTVPAVSFVGAYLYTRKRKIKER